MVRRALGAGRVGLRAMVSAEPWSVPGCGYLSLLATGETCEGINYAIGNTQTSCHGWRSITTARAWTMHWKVYAWWPASPP